MAEYIERKEAISRAKYEFGNVGAKIMSKVPYVINLVPVVFCKDCKHYGSRLDKDNGIHIACYKMNENDFCSYGEKRG